MPEKVTEIMLFQTKTYFQEGVKVQVYNFSNGLNRSKLWSAPGRILKIMDPREFCVFL